MSILLAPEMTPKISEGLPRTNQVALFIWPDTCRGPLEGWRSAAPVSVCGYYGCLFCTISRSLVLPGLVMTNIAIENDPVEIVDFPIEKMVDLSVAMLVITRG